MFCIHWLRGEGATGCTYSYYSPYPLLLEKEVTVYPDNMNKARKIALLYSNLEITCKLANGVS